MRSMELVTHVNWRKLGKMLSETRVREISSRASREMRALASFSLRCSVRTRRAYRVKRSQSLTSSVRVKICDR